MPASTKYKLLVVDIDGTIVDKNGDIADEDRKALAAAAASGIKVSLSTGRVVKACQSIIRQLSLDGHHIFFDGALVSDPSHRSEVYVQPLEREVVRRAVLFAQANDIYLELYSADRFFAEHKNWSDEIHRRFFRIEPTLIDFAGIWERERIIKGELVVHNRQEAVKARIFQDEFAGSLRFSIARSPAYPAVDFINIIAPEVSKGKALEALASFLGVPPSQTMAVGDGLNDIPLLKAAGLAVAMGNAFPEVKQVADFVTLDIDHHGLAAAIKRFLV